VRKDLSGVLRPELVNRLDEIVTFSQLAGDSLRRIVDAYVSDVESRLEDRGLELHLDESVYEMLLERADCAAYGARDLRRLVDKLVRQPLAVEVLRHGEQATAFRLMREGEEITFTVLKDDGLTA
jgi:ATP-dependent Clp protease ATP-binding subunit ClpA